MQIQAPGNNNNFQSNTPVGNQRQVAPVSEKQSASTNEKIESKKPAEDKESVQDATKRLQDFVSGVRGDIQFSMDTDSGKTVVKVVDRSTKEVIRQFPSEEAIELARALDRFQGLLVKQQA